MSTDDHMIELPEKDQILLSRYFDGECGRVSRFLAKRLLDRNPSARAFLAGLEEARNLQSTNSQLPFSVNLWDRVEMRIEQEQRAALYLGERRMEPQVASSRQRFAPRHALVGALSGAALASVAIALMYQPGEILSFSTPPTAVNNSGVFQQIGLGASPRGASNRPNSLAQHPSLEVDWMRSNGSLSFIPDSSGSSATIWIRRRLPRALGRRSRVSVAPTPLGRAAPTATVHTSPRWLDGNGSTGDK